jgi:uncharacterized protein
MTGSLHLVDLPDAAAAHVFAPGGRRFMILGDGDPTMTGTAEGLQDQQLDYMTSAEHGDALIAYGPLRSEVDGDWLGTVALIEPRDRPATEALISRSPYARAGLYTTVEIHNWRFGVRPAV